MDNIERVIEINNLCTIRGNTPVQKNLNLTVQRGESVAIIGPSGCGKTTLLHSILMLNQIVSGKIKVFGVDIAQCSEEAAQRVRQRWGVMFQNLALFSSLTVLENVIFPMQAEVKLNRAFLEELAIFKISLVGLSKDAMMKYPYQLSGGMKKRAALARAIALDPELIFLDEPTSGLDANSADELDHVVKNLQKTLGLTLVTITHDLDTLWTVPDRVFFLGEGKVLAALPMAELVKEKHPLIQDYFHGARARVRLAQHTQG